MLTAGLGGMGGAQPLAATMAPSCALGIEIDPARIEKEAEDAVRRRAHRRSPRPKRSRAIDRQREARRAPLDRGLRVNAADVVPELVPPRRHASDLVTEQTAAHDPLNGYVLQGMNLLLEEAKESASSAIRHCLYRAGKRGDMRVEIRGDARDAASRRGGLFLDYGNNIRTCPAMEAGCEREPSHIPGFVRRTCAGLFCEGKGPFRGRALGLTADDITDD